MFWVMALGGILLIGGIICAIFSLFIPVSEKKHKRLFWGFAIVAAVGLILEMVWMFVLDDTDYSSDNKDDYTGSPQYYEDAYEYYQDNDNWNRDFGEDYGYRW